MRVLNGQNPIGKVIENCRYLQWFDESNRPHFLWVCLEKFASHERGASDLQVFLVFPQHPKWVYYAGKAIENAVYCLDNHCPWNSVQKSAFEYVVFQIHSNFQQPVD